MAAHHRATLRRRPDPPRGGPRPQGAARGRAGRRRRPARRGPEPDVVEDDLLRLVFTCCHPSLAPETRVALALRTLCGLGTEEVARALIVSEPTMAKRLTRARQKIRLAGIPYRVPSAEDLPERWDTVLATTYLLFNEGYAATAGPELTRPALVAEALRLTRLLHRLRPDDPGATGLLALILLQDSRRGGAHRRRWAPPCCSPTRTAPAGTAPPSPRPSRSSVRGCACRLRTRTPTSCRPRSPPATRSRPRGRRPTGRRSSPGTRCCCASTTGRWCGSTTRSRSPRRAGRSEGLDLVDAHRRAARVPALARDPRGPAAPARPASEAAAAADDRARRLPLNAVQRDLLDR